MEHWFERNKMTRVRDDFPFELRSPLSIFDRSGNTAAVWSATSHRLTPITEQEKARSMLRRPPTRYS